MRSFISLHKENWRSHSYAARPLCRGSGAVSNAESEIPISTPSISAWTNDVAGQAANKRISDKLFSKTNSAEFATTK